MDEDEERFSIVDVMVCCPARMDESGVELYAKSFSVNDAEDVEAVTLNRTQQ